MKKKQPAYKFDYRTDTFTDYKGLTRMFTICAVSIPQYEKRAVRKNGKKVMAKVPGKFAVNDAESNKEEIIENWTEPEYVCGKNYNSLVKMLSIGVSVCHEEDIPKENAALGVKIAYGKAIARQDNCIYVSAAGLINTTMVNAVLEQEVNHFKMDPGAYIKGYNSDRDKWITEQNMKKRVKALPSTPKKRTRSIGSGSKDSAEEK